MTDNQDLDDKIACGAAQLMNYRWSYNHCGDGKICRHRVNGLLGATPRNMGRSDV